MHGSGVNSPESSTPAHAWVNRPDRRPTHAMHGVSRIRDARELASMSGWAACCAPLACHYMCAYGRGFISQSGHDLSVHMHVYVPLPACPLHPWVSRVLCFREAGNLHWLIQGKDEGYSTGDRTHWRRKMLTGDIGSHVRLNSESIHQPFNLKGDHISPAAKWVDHNHKLALSFLVN